LKILQISYVFPPKLAIGDGITHVAYNLSKELVRQGHDVSVYTSNALDLTGCRKINTSNPQSVNGVKVHYLDYSFKFHTFFFTPKIISLLNQTISSFDVVHIHDLRSFQGIAAAFFARKHGVPYVYQPHGSFLSNPPRNLVSRILRVIVDKSASTASVRNASRILALNKDEFELFATNLEIPEQKLAIFPNGLDLDLFKVFPMPGKFREKLGLNSTDCMILYLGRIHYTKGISLLLRSFSYLQRNLGFKKAKLVIAGPDGGYLGEARKLAISLGILDSVIFPGFISNEERHQALVDADIFVTPAFTGFPITFLEACASGLPILTTTCGDNLEWLDDKTGIVTSPNSKDLALSMYKILSDEPLRLEMAQKCIDTVTTKYSLEAVTKKLIGFYKDVTNSQKQGDFEQ
jgi:glycosyltransferase involved in cell wall biosynthesis